MDAAPVAAEVIAYLGADVNEDLTALATARLTTVASAARAYCRGLGFTQDGQVAEEIKQVIISATARSVNTSPGILREEAGSYNVTYDGSGNGWTLPELAVMNAYRRRAT